MSECQRVRIGIFHFKRISDCEIRFWYISHIPNLALQEQRRHNLNGASDPFVAQQIQVRLQQQTSGDPSRGMQKCSHNCSDHMSRSCFGGVAWSNTPLGKLPTRHAEARSGETHDGIRRGPAKASHVTQLHWRRRLEPHHRMSSNMLGAAIHIFFRVGTQ